MWAAFKLKDLSRALFILLLLLLLMVLAMYSASGGDEGTQVCQQTAAAEK